MIDLALLFVTVFFLFLIVFLSHLMRVTVYLHKFRVASTVTYPLQVLKSRMQQPPTSIELTNTGDVRIVTRDYKGLVATAQKMWKNEGVTGFFKGAIPNAIRVAPSAAVTFLVYESLMDMMRN